MTSSASDRSITPLSWELARIRPVGTAALPIKGMARPLPCEWLAKSSGANYATNAEDSNSHFMTEIQPELIALGFIFYVAFLFSTTCHEAAHALVAKIGGDDTAFACGQVSLNPVPHIQREPVGMVVVPILSLIATGSLFGWASAPYNPDWERRHPRRA